MTQVFYHVASGEPLEFCRAFKDRWKAKMAAFAEYSEAKGGIGYVENWGYLGGVLFEYGADIPEGFVAAKRRTNDGRTVYQPSRKTAAGKALRKEFDALGRFPMSDEFTTHFGIPHSLTYRKSSECYGSMALHSGGFNTAQVLWVFDDFWIILPDIEAIISAKIAEGYSCEPSYFYPPVGIERSSKSRYDLAVAEAKVREEEGAQEGGAE